MARLVFRSSAVLLLLFVASSALAHPQNRLTRASRSPVEWMNGYTLVLVDARSKAELAEAADFITAQGGTVAIILPPHTIMGWISPEVGEKIVGRNRVRSIHRTPVEPAASGFNDRETRIAVSVFNDIASGARARRALSEARRGVGPNAAHPPMTDCSLPRPPIDKNEVIRNLRLMGAEQSSSLLQSTVQPSFFSYSDSMDGRVAVAVFLVESAGGSDPDLYSWSQADQTTAIAQVIDGLNWWVDQSRAFTLARPLQFTVIPYLANNPVCQQPYEPILHEGREANLWISRIASNMGATSSDIYVRIAAINQRVRDDNRCDWAFSTFIAYNPPPAPTAFRDGRASWAYIGGPHTNVLFRSFGWPLSQIMTHEAGHIFYACDEYSQPGYNTCSCSCAPEVRPSAANGNCEDFSCNSSSTACMMRLNEFALCPFTVAQIGWTAVQPRPVPTAPAGLVASAAGPTQVNLVWQDTSSSEDGFQIERRGGSDGSFSQIAVVSANSAGYNDTSPLANTFYSYRVRAFNSSGESSYSSEINITTPSTPTALSVGTSELPDAITGVSYSRTLTANGGRPDFTWIINSGALPAGLSMSQSGTVSGVPSSAGTSNFVVRVTDSTGSNATKALTLVVRSAAPLTLTTRELPRGSVGTTYSQNLGASGGQTPYAWSIQSGSLPEGLTLNPSGIISGTPERAGTASFSLKVTDAASASVTATLSIVINPAVTQLALETESLPDGILGQRYSEQIKATGGNTPYRWELRSGKLPDGLTLTETGLIQGTPLAVGEVDFEIQVSDQSGQIATRALSIDIDPAPQLTILTQSPLPGAAVGVPYRVELHASAGTAPYSWNKKKKKKFGLLPEGITLSSDGILSGTPTTQGVSNFTIQLKDAAGKTASRPFSIEVGPPPPPLAIRTESLPNATQGLLYNARLEAAGGLGPYTWSIDSGALPDGLAMNAEGAITGRANAGGSTTFTVRVRDSLGTSSTKTLFIIVVPPPPPLVIQTVSLPETTAERSYTQTLRATGGLPPYTWSIASGNLAAGLNLSADGIISGTPTVAGTSVFVVRVTDSAQQSVTRTLAINIKPADKLAPFGNLETPDNRVTLANTVIGTGWALDNVGVTLIEVLIDGQKVGEGTYGLPRPDVAASWGSFPNAGNSGFSFSFDSSRFSNGEHRLAVRVVDASGNATIIGTRVFQAQNQVLTIATVDLPRARRSEPYTAQMVAINGRPPYTWSVISGSLPPGLSLNASGMISGTPTTAGNSSFAVRVTDSINAVAVASFTLGVLPDAEPLNIISRGDLATGRVGFDYSQQLLFAGGRPPRVWSLISGELPPGLNFATELGLIFGRPTRTGTYTFRVQLSDPTPTTIQSDVLRITINPGVLAITSSGDLTTGVINTSYTHQILFGGGTGPYTLAVASGALPPGVNLNTSTGLLTGTPTQTGTFTFTARVTDSTSTTVTSNPLRIIIAETPPLVIISTGTLTAGILQDAYVHQLLASGGRSPYTWALATGALPPGLNLNTGTGLISGAPTQSGTFTFTVRVTDATPTTVTSGTLTIVIAQVAPLVIISTGDLPGGRIALNYSYQVLFQGGLAPYGWTRESGSLPPGLALNISTGTITGKPTTPGIYTFTLRVTDSQQTTTVSNTLRIAVIP